MWRQMDEVSVKVYDKFGKILRIEVTSNNVRAFKAMREAYCRDEGVERKTVPLPKSIYRLFPLMGVFRNAINRGRKREGADVQRVNVFDEEDERILPAVAGGKFNLKCISNKALRKEMPKKSSGQISRTLKRLRLHGLIKKIGRIYLYYLTGFGKQVIVTCLKLKNMFLVPELSHT
jgi:hypothetical protein